MLSEHEFVVAVRDDIFPRVKEIEEMCVALFNKKYQPGIGRTGLSGTNELDWTIQLLLSSVSLLQNIKCKKEYDDLTSTLAEQKSMEAKWLERFIALTESDHYKEVVKLAYEKKEKT